MNSLQTSESVISEVLQKLVTDGHTTAKQLAHIAGVSEHNTIYTWLTYREPPASALRLWISHHPSETVRRALVDVMSGGAAVLVTGDTDGELDADGDGAITPHDALDAAISSTVSAAAVLPRIRKNLQSASTGPQDVLDVCALLHDTEKNAHIARRVLLRHVGEERSRKPARVPRLSTAG